VDAVLATLDQPAAAARPRRLGFPIPVVRLPRHRAGFAGGGAGGGGPGRR
jgi:hypothetical protein